MDIEVAKILASFGLSGALLGAVGWIVWKVGLRMIAAIDRVAAKVDEHTKIDLEHHGYVRDGLVAVNTKLDTIYDLTPIESPTKRRTGPRGVPVSEYKLHRPKTRGDDE